MKILFFSDIHVDAATAGVERIDELASYVETMIATIKSEGVDLVCFLGDAFDPGSLVEARWSSFMVDAALRLARAARFGAVFIPGNHDVLDSSGPLSTLSPLARMAEFLSPDQGFAHGLAVYELPSVHRVGITLDGRPANPGSAAVVLALPYVSRAVERTPMYRNAFEHAIATARAAKFDGFPVVAIGHYTIPGIDPGSEGEMVRGRDLMFPANALRGLAALVVNGHYHARQTVTVDGVRVEIVGAPVRFTFGERDDGPRGFLLAEV